MLQFKPGILTTEALSEELLSRVELAIGLARRDVMGKAVRKAS